MNTFKLEDKRAKATKVATICNSSSAPKYITMQIISNNLFKIG